GNVGIGTTGPMAKLFVHVDTDKNFGVRNDVNSPEIYSTNDANNAWGVLRINSSTLLLNDQSLGNVGIGTTAPSSKLNVENGDFTFSRVGTGAGGSFGAIIARFSPTIGTAAVIDFIRPNANWGNEGEIRFLTNPGSSPGTADASDVRMVIDRTGNVGIGTTNPLSKLSVAGLGSSTGTALVIDANGNIYKDSSSIRFKENLKPLDSDFSKILALTPYSFNFKETGASDIGYMAEDVAAAGLTDLVLYDSEGRPSSIKYSRMPLYAFEILKSQQLKLTELENNLSKLGLNPSQIFDASDIELNTPLPSENLTISEGSAEIPRIREILTPLNRDMEILNSRLSVLETYLGIGNTGSIQIGNTNPDGSLEIIDSTDSTLQTNSTVSEFVNSLKEIISVSTDNIAIDQNLILYKDLNVLGKTTVNDLAVTGDVTVGLLTIDGLCSTGTSLVETEKLQGEDSDSGLGSLGLDTCKSTGVSLKTLAGDLSLQGLVRITKEGNVVLETGVLAGNSSFRDNITVPAGKGTIFVKRGIPCPNIENNPELALSEYNINQEMCVSNENTKWTTPPVTVNTTPDYNTNVWVENITNEGFTIKLGTPSEIEQKVYWIAVW
ncbi:MAG: tail fiber domain-containing protein, partial [bacterium]